MGVTSRKAQLTGAGQRTENSGQDGSLRSLRQEQTSGCSPLTSPWTAAAADIQARSGKTGTRVRQAQWDCSPRRAAAGIGHPPAQTSSHWG